MVVHQAPGVANPVELGDHLCKGPKKRAPVVVILKDVLAGKWGR
jgi:hypothetical protein